MAPLPCRLYRAEDVRELDRTAIEEFSIPGDTLMTRAGQAAFDGLRKQWPGARRIAVICGLGNNAGDGYVVARLAAASGMAVSVLQLGDTDRIRGDALSAFNQMRETPLVPQPFDAARLLEADVLVDAVFGTGLDREVTGPWREAIDAINGSGIPVLALDIPSGLNADTGVAWGAAVRASATITFIGLKQGMFTGQAPDHCGCILFDDLDVPEGVYDAATPSAWRMSDGERRALLAPRARTAHKGHFGHVLVAGGNRGMPGAVHMAAEAAARGGAGLVSVATHDSHAPFLSSMRPEVMCHGIRDASDMDPLLERATVLAVGPGLGQDEWGRTVLQRALSAGLPLVVDADALNLLATMPTRHDQWILTPHPGEAARLLGVGTQRIEGDRFDAVASLQASYGGVVVLKGAGTLICDLDERITVTASGNPGLASGGMGDILTGLIAALLAQGLSLGDAARVGAYVHGLAADRAAIDGERGMLASDVLHQLRAVLNPEQGGRGA